MILPVELSPLVAVMLVAVSFITSGISATFGLGGGVAMLIVLLSFTSPVAAIPVHALVQIGSNTGRAWMMKTHIMGDVVCWFVPGTIVGIVVASFLFTSLPVSLLQLILALFVLWAIWAPKLKVHVVPAKAYIAVGGFSSFCTMFLGATGPLLASFLSPERYGRDRTVATHAACMGLQHLAKVIAFGLMGFVFTDWILLIVLMIVSGLFGTWVGRLFLHRLPEAQFKIVFKAVLTLLAMRLLFGAVGRW